MEKQRSAFIVIVGKPNVGKSTILNQLVGEKIAIVSKKPQTTRTRIMGVLTQGEDRLVLSRGRFSEKPAPRITARLHGHVSARFFGTHTYHTGSDLLGYGKRVPAQTAEDGKSGSSPLDHKISGAMH